MGNSRNSQFILVDCNNFFVSCERAFQPELRGKPVVVLSNNDGCFVSRSNEAKALGIPMGAPLFQYEHVIKLHDIKTFSSNFLLYGDMSNRVMSILEQFTENIEIYSVDEAFLQVDDLSPEQLLALGKEIKARVYKWTGIPVSVGVAHTKTLAKIAAHEAKKSDSLGGVGVLGLMGDVNEILKKTPAGEVWGIGYRSAKTLQSYGINSAYDLTLWPDKSIRKVLSVSGLRTVTELRGTPCIPLEDSFHPRKGIMCTRMFGKVLTEFDEIYEAVVSYTTRAIEKLREQRSVATHISTYIRTDLHSGTKEQYSQMYTYVLEVASDYTPDFIKAAEICLKNIYKPGFRYKKAGVMIQNITQKENMQYSLLKKPEPVEDGKKARAMEAIDRVNQKWGSQKLRPLASGLKQEWRSKRGQMSPCYTTNWEELLEITL
jgi:DNA polymerase V